MDRNGQRMDQMTGKGLERDSQSDMWNSIYPDKTKAESWVSLVSKAVC